MVKTCLSEFFGCPFRLCGLLRGRIQISDYIRKRLLFSRFVTALLRFLLNEFIDRLCDPHGSDDQRRW